jgi:hypothetical protein
MTDPCPEKPERRPTVKTVLWPALTLVAGVVLAAGCQKAPDPGKEQNGDKAAPPATDPDTEYYCPMHPQVVRDNKDKCPICAMPLSRRKKGEATDGPPAAGTASTPSATRPKLSPEDQAEIRASLAELPPADKKAAEAQWLCPVQGELLGSMGVPVKVTLDGTPVFLCCKGCVGKAQRDPGKTLKAVAEAKAKSGR